MERISKGRRGGWGVWVKGMAIHEGVSGEYDRVRTLFNFKFKFHDFSSFP